MFKFTYSDKNIYVKLIRMIMRCFCYLNINKHNVPSIHNFLYKILLPFKDKGIKLFSNRENCFYFCPYRDINRFIEGADWKRYNTNNLFPVIFSYLKNKNSTIVEIGSSWGEEILFLSKLAGKSGKLYCFEPNPESFYCLKKNKENLNLKNLKLFNLGVYKKKALIRIKEDICGEPRVWARNMEYAKSEKEKNIIKFTKLDDVIKGRIDLIKIDTDGYDLDIILGSLNLIKKFKPIIIVEFLPGINYSGLFDIDVLKKYRKLGFKILLPQFHPTKIISNEKILSFFSENSFSLTHELVLIYDK